MRIDARQPVLILLAVTMLTACPTFEDAFSGTYRQQVDEETTGPVYEVEFFRFGKYAQAIVRQYDLVAPNDRNDRFVEYTDCVWTETSVFDAERASFDLVVQDSQRRLVGLINDDGTAIAELRGPDVNNSLELERLTTEADDECMQAREFQFSARFPEGNVFGESVDYAIENPKFTILWLGVLATNIGQTTVFSGTRQNPRSARPLSQILTQEKNGLVSPSSNFRYGWPPPDDDILVFSGSTRYTLGHFIVVDDDERDSDPFSWSIADEPIVAAGVIAGRRQSIAIEHNGFGRVVLYVEGDIRELDESMLSMMSVITSSGDLAPIDDITNPDRNYFHAEAFFFNDEILRLDIYDNPTPVAVKVTDDWFGDEITLPRLFP